jgi:integrative and conjugative element protein (TIGR02256 family)
MTPVGILITGTALDAAITDGLAALPQETGGILLGFRTPDLVVVTRALTVPDPRSSRHSYRRHRRRAQAQMAAVGINETPGIGYVGEWHTHPADCPPSRIDIRALTATARLTTTPVALIVLAHRADQSVAVHGLTAVREPWPVPAVSPVQLFPASPTVTDDTAASLEAEAAEALTHPEEAR